MHTRIGGWIWDKMYQCSAPVWQRGYVPKGKSHKSAFPKVAFGFIVVQSLRHVLFLATPWTTVHQDSLSFTISQSLLKFMSIEWVMLSNHLILYCPLFLLPSIFPTIRVFSRVGSSHQVAKILELQHQSFQ